MMRAVITFLAVSLLGAAAHAETVTFPPFVLSHQDTGSVVVPKCTVTGRRMNCEFLVVSAFPFVVDAGKDGQCMLSVVAQSVEFRRRDADTWVGDVTAAYCRTKTIYQFSRSSEKPRRIKVRQTFELGDKSESCQKSFTEAMGKLKDGAVEWLWVEKDASPPIAVPMPSCKSYFVPSGQFPEKAFSR